MSKINRFEDEYSQIVIDVKRTTPHEVFSSKRVKNMLTRVLFIWMFKHQASGYVQGINDLAATLMYVFLQEKCDMNIKSVEEADQDIML